MRRKAKGTVQHHTIAQFKLRSLTCGTESVATIHDQYEVARRFVESLNAAMSKALGTVVTVLEGRLTSQEDDLIVEVVCVLPAQMRLDWDASEGQFSQDPYALLERARTEWAYALRSALLNEEAFRSELPGLATAATRMTGIEVNASQMFMRATNVASMSSRGVPGEVVYASQGNTEFDLTHDFSHPVWIDKCTIRARPSLARHAVAMQLIEAPSGFIGRSARAHIDDIPAHCFQVIAGAVKRREALDLEVQLALTPTKVKGALCKVLDAVAVN